MKRLLLFMPAMIIFCSVTVRAQISEIEYWRNDSVKVVTTDIRDENNVPYTTYAQVVQTFGSVELRLLVGETEKTTGNGDRIGLLWDHPLARVHRDLFVPLYEFNSTSHANQIVTIPFRLTPNDTLLLFREFSFALPMRDADGNDRTFSQDTTNFEVPDSIAYILELIDAEDGSLLRTVETIVVPSCSSWTDFCMSLPGIVQQAKHENETVPFRITLTGGAGEDVHTVRLRVRAVYLPQLRADFTHRALYARFLLSPRLSLYLEREWPDRIRAMQAVLDSMNVMAALPKGCVEAHIPVGVHHDQSITIGPQTLRFADPVLNIGLPSLKQDGQLTVMLLDLKGSVVDLSSMMVQSGRSEASARLHAMQLPMGWYIAVAVCNDLYNSSLIRAY